MEAFVAEDSIINVALDDIVIDANYRQTMNGIEDLADSIEANGLLQNLVVIQIPPSGKYKLLAGHRRFAALKLLHEQQKWQRPVPCLVKTDKTLLISLIENELRAEVPDWETGAHFKKLIDMGVAQKQIALTLHKSSNYVGSCITIAEGLAPETIAVLERIGVRMLTRMQLLQAAHLIDEYGKPDAAKQLKMVYNILNGEERVSRKGRRPAGEMEEIRKTVYNRYRNLMMRQEPVVTAVCRFLDGRDQQLILPEPFRINRSKIKRAQCLDIVKEEINTLPDEQ